MKLSTIVRKKNVIIINELHSWQKKKQTIPMNLRQKIFFFQHVKFSKEFFFFNSLILLIEY